MRTNAFASVEFDLAYLALLTHEGVKPLSRWEKTPDDRVDRFLRQQGLEVAHANRPAKSGKTIRESVFSRQSDLVAQYLEWFDGQPVAYTALNMTREGRLFGYPECCVQSYIQRGYARNGFRRRDQRRLFHWACPGCEATSQLLETYLRIHDECLRIRGSGGASSLAPWPQHGRTGWAKYAAACAAAAAGSAALVLAGTNPSASSFDHWWPLDPAIDQDQDFLTDEEEAAMLFDPADADEDGNGRPDGVDLAETLGKLMAAYPNSWDNPPNDWTSAPYVVYIMTKGMESCPICGEGYNMGNVYVVNPLAEHTNEVNPMIGEHFLEKGSFTWQGSYNGTGRFDAVSLRRAIEANVVDLEISQAGDDVVLNWASISGVTYRVVSAPALEGPWESGPVYTGHGGTITHTEPGARSEPLKVYKVIWW